MTMPPQIPPNGPAPNSASPQPCPAPQEQKKTLVTTATAEPGAGYSVDELFDFFDFFDKSVEDVYSYVLHCTRVPELASDITLSVYFSLLQRRRVLFWKNVVQLSTLMALADRAIGSMQKWEEEAMGTSYLEELLRCSWDGKEKGTLERMRLVLRALKKLPLREQKMAVLQYFLRWGAAKTASIMGKTKQSVERDYSIVENLLMEELQKEQAFQGVHVRDVLRSLHCPPLENSRKTALRVALLERCRSAQMSSLRFVVPMAASSAFLGCVLIFAMFLLQPLSAQDTLRQIAAVEVLVASREIEARDAFLSAEQTLRGIAAHYGQKDLAQIVLALTPHAIAKQLEQETTIRGILQKLTLGGLRIPLISFEEAWAQGAEAKRDR